MSGARHAEPGHEALSADTFSPLSMHGGVPAPPVASPCTKSSGQKALTVGSLCEVWDDGTFGTRHGFWMLGKLLHPLDRRQQSLLLATVAFSGSQAEALWSLLPDNVAAALAQKHSKLDEIPREKRVPIVVRELKGWMAFRGTKGIDGVEPSWLAAGFKGESPRMIAVALMFLPSSMSRQIVQRLPEHVQRALPGRSELMDVPLDVAKLVRARFERKFIAMPSDRELLALGFLDVVHLSARELITVVRHVGADEIACAFLAVGKRALAEFLTKLSPQDSEELLAAVRRADLKDGMELKAAQAFLGKILATSPVSGKGGNNTPSSPLPRAGGTMSGVAFANTEELFQRAGVYRLARALLAVEPLVVQQLVLRFPRAHGRLLLEYIERCRERGNDESQGARLRDHILDVIINLSQRGKIDARYAAVPPRFELR